MGIRLGLSFLALPSLTMPRCCRRHTRARSHAVCCTSLLAAPSHPQTSFQPRTDPLRSLALPPCTPFAALATAHSEQASQSCDFSPTETSLPVPRLFLPIQESRIRQDLAASAHSRQQHQTAELMNRVHRFFAHPPSTTETRRLRPSIHSKAPGSPQAQPVPSLSRPCDGRGR
jgi:hypothetical protein